MTQTWMIMINNGVTTILNLYATGSDETVTKTPTTTDKSSATAAATAETKPVATTGTATAPSATPATTAAAAKRQRCSNKNASKKQLWKDKSKEFIKIIISGVTTTAVKTESATTIASCEAATTTATSSSSTILASPSIATFVDEDTRLLDNLEVYPNVALYRSRSCSDLYHYKPKCNICQKPDMSSSGNFNIELIRSAFIMTTIRAQQSCNILKTAHNLLVNYKRSTSTPQLAASTSLKSDIFDMPLEIVEEEEARLKRRCWLTRALKSGWCIWLVWPLIFLSTLVVVAYFTKDYANELMLWTEKQNQFIVMGIIVALFILVSFPIALGYFVLKLATGYLYGFLIGIAIVLLSTVLGTFLAHLVLHGIHKRFNLQKFIKNKTAIAILRVINGRRSFRIVMFSRMTPLPYGLLNLILSLSSIGLLRYMIASFIGMLPSQLLAVYLGSGLRSMQEVLTNNTTVVPTYVLIGVGVVLGFSLMTWIVIKSRVELAKMMNEDLAAEARENENRQ